MSQIRAQVQGLQRRLEELRRVGAQLEAELAALDAAEAAEAEAAPVAPAPQAIDVDTVLRRFEGVTVAEVFERGYADFLEALRAERAGQPTPRWDTRWAYGHVCAAALEMPAAERQRLQASNPTLGRLVAVERELAAAETVLYDLPEDAPDDQIRQARAAYDRAVEQRTALLASSGISPIKMPAKLAKSLMESRQEIGQYERERQYEREHPGEQKPASGEEAERRVRLAKTQLARTTVRGFIHSVSLTSPRLGRAFAALEAQGQLGRFLEEHGAATDAYLRLEGEHGHEKAGSSENFLIQEAEARAKLQCAQCGHSWFPRVDQPRKCPQCGASGASAESSHRPANAEVSDAPATVEAVNARASGLMGAENLNVHAALAQGVNMPASPNTSQFLTGSCGHFAIAMHMLTGWQLGAFMEMPEGEDGPEVLAHAVVEWAGVPGQEVVDAVGSRSVADMLRRYEADGVQVVYRQITPAELDEMMGESLDTDTLADAFGVIAHNPTLAAMTHVREIAAAPAAAAPSPLLAKELDRERVEMRQRFPGKFWWIADGKAVYAEWEPGYRGPYTKLDVAEQAGVDASTLTQDGRGAASAEAEQAIRNYAHRIRKNAKHRYAMTYGSWIVGGKRGPEPTPPAGVTKGEARTVQDDIHKLLRTGMPSGAARGVEQHPVERFALEVLSTSGAIEYANSEAASVSASGLAALREAAAVIQTMPLQSSRWQEVSPRLHWTASKLIEARIKAGEPSPEAHQFAVELAKASGHERCRFCGRWMPSAYTSRDRYQSEKHAPGCRAFLPETAAVTTMEMAPDLVLRCANDLEAAENLTPAELEQLRRVFNSMGDRQFETCVVPSDGFKFAERVGHELITFIPGRDNTDPRNFGYAACQFASALAQASGRLQCKCGNWLLPEEVGNPDKHKGGCTATRTPETPRQVTDEQRFGLRDYTDSLTSERDRAYVAALARWYESGQPVDAEPSYLRYYGSLHPQTVPESVIQHGEHLKRFVERATRPDAGPLSRASVQAEMAALADLPGVLALVAADGTPEALSPEEQQRLLRFCEDMNLQPGGWCSVTINNAARYYRTGRETERGPENLRHLARQIVMASGKVRCAGCGRYVSPNYDDPDRHGPGCRTLAEVQLRGETNTVVQTLQQAVDTGYSADAQYDELRAFAGRLTDEQAALIARDLPEATTALILAERRCQAAERALAEIAPEDAERARPVLAEYAQAVQARNEVLSRTYRTIPMLATSTTRPATCLRAHQVFTEQHETRRARKARLDLIQSLSLAQPALAVQFAELEAREQFGDFLATWGGTFSDYMDARGAMLRDVQDGPEYRRATRLEWQLRGVAQVALDLPPRAEEREIVPDEPAAARDAQWSAERADLEARAATFWLTEAQIEDVLRTAQVTGPYSQDTLGRLTRHTAYQVALKHGASPDEAEAFAAQTAPVQGPYQAGVRCGKCGYEWRPRVVDARECPRCGTVFSPATITPAMPVEEQATLHITDDDPKPTPPAPPVTPAAVQAADPAAPGTGATAPPKPEPGDAGQGSAGDASLDTIMAMLKDLQGQVAAAEQRNAQLRGELGQE